MPTQSRGHGTPAVDPAASGTASHSDYCNSFPIPRCALMNVEVTITKALAEQLASRLELRTARVAVVGLGYVGLPLAETFASAGYTVVGFDIDPKKVNMLRTGQSYIGHISAERVGDLVRTERFEPTS